MAGQSDTTPKTLPLGKGQGLTMSPTQGQAILLWATPYQPFRSPQEGQLYGWLPLSNAYGISSRCNKIHNIIPNGIPSVVSQSPNLTAECAPERGNEPLAQGTALGNLKQHKMIRPDRAKAPHTIQHPRRRLGLYDCWSFRPPLYGRVFIDWLL